MLNELTAKRLIQCASMFRQQHKLLWNDKPGDTGCQEHPSHRAASYQYRIGATVYRKEDSNSEHRVNVVIHYHRARDLVSMTMRLCDDTVRFQLTMSHENNSVKNVLMDIRPIQSTVDNFCDSLKIAEAEIDILGLFFNGYPDRCSPVENIDQITTSSN